MAMQKQQSTIQTLGVVAISYNEERDLPGFIDHLLPWVDEIVIVDDGSSDRTADIAAAGGDKMKFLVLPRGEGEYFSHQRNKGIDAAESDWLLHMDIDERVPPDLAHEIQGAILDGSKDAYRYRRLNYFLHRPMQGGGWQSWNLVHLARRDIFRFGGMYHEDCLVDTTDERVGQMGCKMWHLNDDTYLERMQKSNLYCQEQAVRLKEKGVQVRWWHLLLLPCREFISKFLMKSGYKDGSLGLLFALHSGSAVFRACALLWDEQNQVAREGIERELKSDWERCRCVIEAQVDELDELR
ncbi:glycosyl transferase, family 2 [hydrothermal vent metagenome]|uniref:Glycosyl transferase, family 2 n=1 Tax=hydrothermal vent metagenome TaxID=652676 RepID=A0A3B1BK33_9ZZZZ